MCSIGEAVTPTTVHMLDGLLNDPIVLGASLALVMCNCLMMLRERLQTIQINALVIDRLRATTSARAANDVCLCGMANEPPQRREAQPIWVSYGARARHDRRGNR